MARLIESIFVQSISAFPPIHTTGSAETMFGMDGAARVTSHRAAPNVASID